MGGCDVALRVRNGSRVILSREANQPEELLWRGPRCEPSDSEQDLSTDVNMMRIFRLGTNRPKILFLGTTFGTT